MTRFSRRSSARLLALVSALALIAAACGGGDDDASTAADDATTTSAAADGSDGDTETGDEPEDEGDDERSVVTSDDDAGADDGEGEATDDASGGGADIPFGNCTASQAANPEQVYSVSNIPANDPDGGLVARLLPGAGEQAIDVLPDGTIVDIFDVTDCAALADGSVWWFVETPQLATGGYVNSAFLAGQTDLGQESDGNAAGGGEDDFDVALAQVDCVYGGADESCDLLVLAGIGTVDDNFGLGNSYSSAPAGFLAEDCLIAFDPIACAELEFRGPGGDIAQIGTDYITAYQAGDAAGQQALSGDRNTAEINSSDLTASQGEFGLASASFFGSEFSWTPQPSISARCFVTDGLVQYCTVTGD